LAVFSRDAMISGFFGALAAMAFFAMNLMTYWTERKVDETDGAE